MRLFNLDDNVHTFVLKYVNGFPVVELYPYPHPSHARDGENIKEFKIAVPNYIELTFAGTIDQHPKLTFLDKIGPSVVTVNIGGGSDYELSVPDLVHLCGNMQEAFLLEEKLNAEVESDEKYEWIRDQMGVHINCSEIAPTNDLSYLKEILNEYAGEEEDD